MQEARGDQAPGLVEIPGKRQRGTEAVKHRSCDGSNAKEQPKDSAALWSDRKAIAKAQQQAKTVEKTTRAKNEVRHGSVRRHVLAQRAAHRRHGKSEARATLMAAVSGRTDERAAGGTQTRASLLLLRAEH